MATKEEIELDIDRASHMMGMDDWEITLVDECESSEELYGSIDAVPEYKMATVYINPETEDVFGTVVHELLHALLWEFSTAASLMAKTPAEEEWLRVAEERAVHALQNMAVFNADA